MFGFARSGEEIDMHLAFAMYHLSAIGKAAFNFDLKVALSPCSRTRIGRTVTVIFRTVMIIPTVMGYSPLRAPLTPPPPIACLPARATRARAPVTVHCSVPICPTPLRDGGVCKETRAAVAAVGVNSARRTATGACNATRCAAVRCVATCRAVLQSLRGRGLPYR